MDAAPDTDRSQGVDEQTQTKHLGDRQRSFSHFELIPAIRPGPAVADGAGPAAGGDSAATNDPTSNAPERGSDAGGKLAKTNFHDINEPPDLSPAPEFRYSFDYTVRATAKTRSALGGH